MRGSSQDGILFAVTDDAKLALEYYPLFKIDHVSPVGSILGNVRA